MSPNPAQPPSPALIFDTFNGFQRSVALKSACELEIFTHIADGIATAHALAEKTGASERGVRILCDLLVVVGFLTKTNGQYGLTQDSAIFLNKRSPAYMGSIANFLVHDEQIANFRNVTGAVKKGAAVHQDVAAQPENPIWEEFARSMAPLTGLGAKVLGPLVAKSGTPIKVLDIAASHGMFGINVALANPQAQIYGLDWPNVLPVAVENAKKLGVADRYHTIPGSVFDIDLGQDYDVVLLPNFVHMFDRPKNVALFKKIRSALKPGGVLATVEFVPNEDRITPPQAAAFAFTMLCETDGGDAYTLAELDAMLREAGFGASELRSLDPAPQQLVLTKV